MKTRAVIPRLITFDVTGTLLMTNLEKHYSAAAASHGLKDFDNKKLLKSFKASFKRLETEHPVFGKDTGIGWENWWRTLVHDVIKDQYKDIDRDKLDKIADSLIDCYSTSRCWHKYPGTCELLDALSKHNVVLGVISNFDERLDGILKSARIRSYFSFVLTSYGFGAEKPCPDIFQEALRLASTSQSKAICPEEAIHIGDKIKNDYHGARSAKWNAILMNREDSPVDDKVVDPCDVYKNFDDLKTYFDDVLTKRQVCGT